MNLTQQTNFDNLINNVYQTHCLLQQDAQKAVNLNLTIRNWLIGFYTVEFEQNGKDRAQYGTRLLEEMAKRIKAKGIKGLDAQSLRMCRMFYSVYPQFSEVAYTKIQYLNRQQIRGSVTRKLQITEKQENIIRGLLTRETQIRRLLTAELQITENQETYPIPNELLLSRLSYTHFVELLRAKEPLERLFYEVEAIKNNWSVKELERAFDTGLYVRTGLSTDKEAVIAKFKIQKPANNVDVIRDPYFLEFLGLEERSEYSESELEQAILNNLQQFLIELGTGFCFEARQKRIT